MRTPLQLTNGHSLVGGGTIYCWPIEVDWLRHREASVCLCLGRERTKRAEWADDLVDGRPTADAGRRGSSNLRVDHHRARLLAILTTTP